MDPPRGGLADGWRCSVDVEVAGEPHRVVTRPRAGLALRLVGRACTADTPTPHLPATPGIAGHHVPELYIQASNTQDPSASLVDVAFWVPLHSPFSILPVPRALVLSSFSRVSRPEERRPVGRPAAGHPPAHSSRELSICNCAALHAPHLRSPILPPHWEAGCTGLIHAFEQCRLPPENP